MYVTARSCVCDVICCVLVLARIIHMSPRARVHVYSCVAIAILLLCRNHSMALCHNRHFSFRCVAITLRRCVAIAMFLFVVSQSLFGVVSQSPFVPFPSVVSQSLFGVVSQSPICLCRNHSLQLERIGFDPQLRLIAIVCAQASAGRLLTHISTMSPCAYIQTPTYSSYSCAMALDHSAHASPCAHTRLPI